MSHLSRLFDAPLAVNESDPAKTSRIQRRGAISGMMKKVAEVVDANPEKYASVLGVIPQALETGRGDTGAENLDVVKAKGRPKHARCRSSTEVTKKILVKCSRCGQRGHNARSHKNDKQI